MKWKIKNLHWNIADSRFQILILRIRTEIPIRIAIPGNIYVIIKKRPSF